jgi:flagellar biogenesis protein FliO
MKVISITGICLALSLLAFNPAFADSVNSTNAPLMPASSSFDVVSSMFRMAGAFLLVIGIFLGGVWLVRNWQRLNVQRGVAPKLSVLEMRSLGARQAVYVVGYEQERFLVAASPAGVNLLSHLPAATEGQAGEVGKTAPPTFTEALKQVLKGR